MNIYLKFIFLIFNGLMLFSCRNIYQGNGVSWETKKVELQQSMDTMQTDFEKVNYLRRFVASHVDIGSNKIHSDNYLSLTSEQIYNLFEDDSITVYCGGTTDYLQKIYNDFGFQSYKYDCGGRETGATHEFNLVEINDDGDKKLIIQDAYFDHTFTDFSGKPLSFEEIISLLKRREENIICISQGNTIGNALVDNRILCWFHWNLKKSEPHEIYRSKNKKVPILIRQYRNVDFFVNSVGLKRRYFSFLEEKMMPCDLKYLLLFPQGNEKWINQIVYDILND